MSDSTPVRSLPFNPLHDDLPRGLEAPGEGDGEFIVLLSDPELDAPAWTPRTARALARGWAREGLEVLLVDGHVENPSLHTDLKQAAGEGLSDLVLWGASQGRVTAAVDSEPFRFISAGTVVPDADRIWNHSRWPFLISDLREMGKVTLLLAPGNDPGVAAVARIADRVFWLGDPRAASRDRDLLTLAIHPDSLAIPQVEDTGADPLADLPGGGEFQLEPEAPESGAEEVEVVGTASGLTGSAQETLSEKPEVAREARRKEAAARVHRSTTPPRPGSRSRGGRGGRLGLLLAILVVLVVLAIAGHYMEWLIVPGLPEVSPTP